MKQLLLILSLLLIVGCSGKSNYHKLALDRTQTLGNTGIIVGIEKYYWKDADQKKGTDITRYKPGDLGSKHSDNFINYTSGSKVMLVSHILEFQDGIRTKDDLYNPFIFPENKEHQPEIDPEDVRPKYEEGYIQLDKLKDKIRDDLNKGNYTHVIYMSMGWNNDQKVSLERYKTILEKLEKQDKKDGTNDFKPYTVAITWPSVWGGNAKSKVIKTTGHILSYFNKPGDADEIGLTTSNYLLHNIILNAVSSINKTKNQKIKTVGIGHSLGARLITRSICSKNYLKKDMSNGSSLDLFIGLQPAFSANRFITDGGVEGFPFDNHVETGTKFLVTSSQYDKANRVAFWSEHLGGKDAWDTVKGNSKDFHFVNAKFQNETLYLTYEMKEKKHDIDIKDLWNTSPKTVKFMNCEFIKKHSNITDDQMGLFLFEVIMNSGI
jgi:hypothetical protein